MNPITSLSYLMQPEETEEITSFSYPKIKQPITPSSEVKKLFKGTYLPSYECKLLSSEKEFNEKLAREKSRIVDQMSRQCFYQRIADDLENCDKPGYIEPGSILTWTGCNETALFVTRKSPYHINQDHFVHFSSEINFRGTMSSAKVYAVFDGHGERYQEGEAAIFCKENLRDVLDECMRELNQEGANYTISNALKMSCVLLDSRFKEVLEREFPDNVRQFGTTVCLVMIVEDHLFSAGCGDSRAVLNKGKPDETEQLTYDFSASDEYARQTSTKRGGLVAQDSKKVSRVNKSLAMTRAIGNEHLRNRYTDMKPISSRPKVNLVVIDPEWKNASVIIASDGYFDKVSSAQTGAIVCDFFRNGKQPSDIAPILLHAALHAGSLDDITVGVIPLTSFS